MSLAEFGEIADQQLAKGNPVPALGGPKSGKAYLKPPEDNGASEGSELEEQAPMNLPTLINLQRNVRKYCQWTAQRLEKQNSSYII
jgi:hypothetical protein